MRHYTEVRTGSSEILLSEHLAVLLLSALSSSSRSYYQAASALGLRLALRFGSALRLRPTPSHWRRLCRRHALRLWRRAAAALRRLVLRLCCGVVALLLRSRCGFCRAIEGGSAARIVRRKKIRRNQKQSSAR